MTSSFVRVEITNFIDVVEFMARRGFREYSVSQLLDGTGLSQAQLRGVLRSGEARGWFRPCFDGPDTSGRVKRWTLGERVPLLAETYRVGLIQRAQALDEQFQRLVEAPQQLRIPGGG